MALPFLDKLPLSFPCPSCEKKTVFRDDACKHCGAEISTEIRNNYIGEPTRIAAKKRTLERKAGLRAQHAAIAGRVSKGEVARIASSLNQVDDAPSVVHEHAERLAKMDAELRKQKVLAREKVVAPANKQLLALLLQNGAKHLDDQPVQVKSKGEFLITMDSVSKDGDTLFGTFVLTDPLHGPFTYRAIFNEKSRYWDPVAV